MCIREWCTQYFCDNMCRWCGTLIWYIKWKSNKWLHQNNYESMYPSGTHEICMAKFKFSDYLCGICKPVACIFSLVKCKNGRVRRRLWCCSCKLYDRITPPKGKRWYRKLGQQRQVLLKCRYQPMTVSGHVYVCKGCRFFSVSTICD